MSLARTLLITMAFAGVTTSACTAQEATEPDASVGGVAWDFAFNSITGEEMPLSAYEGQPLLIVNTASRCGFTPQYDGLQALWETYRDQELILIGVPSNDFNQELATEDDVREFCEVNFSIDFPMTEITHVRGDDAHPFYQWTREVLGEAGEPNWNFNKILIGRDGRPVAAWRSRTAPDDDNLIAAIESELSPPAAE